MLSKSSYLRYKDDTKAFATWLINSAEVCGYKFTPRNTGANGAFEKFPTTAPSSLNDKAKKEAKIAAAEVRDRSSVFSRQPLTMNHAARPSLSYK